MVNKIGNGTKNDAIFWQKEGDSKDSWMTYSDDVSAFLEKEFQSQNGTGTANIISLESTLTVDFIRMEERNDKTRLARQIRRGQTEPIVEEKDPSISASYLKE